MTDYTGRTASSIFLVKDPTYVENFLRQNWPGLAHFESDDDGAITLRGIESWPSGFDIEGYEDAEEEFDFFGWIADQLPDGETATFTEIGYEGLRYLVGVAVAVTNEGIISTIDLSDINKTLDEAA